MTKDWVRLARAVAARRRELGLSQDAIRQAGGPSDVVVARIENADQPHPRPDTLNKLDAPLRWEQGSALRVLAGGEPTVMGSLLQLHKVDIDVLLAEIRRRVLNPSIRQPAEESLLDVMEGKQAQHRGAAG